VLLGTFGVLGGGRDHDGAAALEEVDGYFGHVDIRHWADMRLDGEPKAPKITAREYFWSA
jgi:hypothetical protein